MSEGKEKKELIFNGIPASPGIAFGEAYVVNVDEFVVDEDRISEDAVEDEIRRFREALSETESQLLELFRKIKEEMGEEHAKILDTHRMILADDVMIKETAVRWGFSVLAFMFFIIIWRRAKEEYMLFPIGREYHAILPACPRGQENLIPFLLQLPSLLHFGYSRLRILFGRQMPVGLFLFDKVHKTFQ